MEQLQIEGFPQESHERVLSASFHWVGKPLVPSAIWGTLNLWVCVYVSILCIYIYCVCNVNYTSALFSAFSMAG